jgi:glycosyltransferase involved in cell wall biosynthesis
MLESIATPNQGDPPRPLISVGLPVYNGETYIAGAIEAHLAQTITDFELIISDNASTDNTQAICLAYARQDARVRYFRSDTNRGLTWNHRRTLELSRGEYFRWAAADDVPEPNLMACHLELMQHDPCIVVCVPATKNVDALGNVTAVVTSTLHLVDEGPLERAKAVLTRNFQFVYPQGLMRRSVLSGLRIRWNHYGWDMIALLQLALAGRIAQPEGAWLHRRLHAKQASILQRNAREAGRAMEPTFSSRLVFPHWRWQMVRMVVTFESQLSPREKLALFVYLVRYSWWGRAKLWRDVVLGLRRLIGKSDEISL